MSLASCASVVWGQGPEQAFGLCMLGRLLSYVGQCCRGATILCSGEEKKALKFLLQVHERDAHGPVRHAEVLQGRDAKGELPVGNSRTEGWKPPQVPGQRFSLAQHWALRTPEQDTSGTCARAPRSWAMTSVCLCLKLACAPLWSQILLRGMNSCAGLPLNWYSCRQPLWLPAALGEEGLGNPLMNASLPKQCLPGLSALWWKYRD